GGVGRRGRSGSEQGAEQQQGHAGNLLSVAPLTAAGADQAGSASRRICTVASDRHDDRPGMNDYLMASALPYTAVGGPPKVLGRCVKCHVVLPEQFVASRT